MPAVPLQVPEGLAPSHTKVAESHGGKDQPSSSPLAESLPEKRMLRSLGYSNLYLSLVVASW